jgi:chorismate mutase
MDIADWRKKIDDLDRRLVELLNARALAAKEIGKLKQNTKMPIYEPDREKVIHENVHKHNRGPLPEKDLKDIYERIIDVMRRLQTDEMPKRAKAAKSGETELEPKD